MYSEQNTSNFPVLSLKPRSQARCFAALSGGGCLRATLLHSMITPFRADLEGKRGPSREDTLLLGTANRRLAAQLQSQQFERTFGGDYLSAESQHFNCKRVVEFFTNAIDVNFIERL